MPTAPPQARAIHPQILDAIAAQVFWNYCSRFDFQKTTNHVLEGNFAQLWKRDHAAALLRPYADQVDANMVKDCYEQTNRYMQDHAQQEKNILGTLYAEDFARGRPPQFPHQALVQRLSRTVTEDEAQGGVQGTLPTAGELLIRTPLPAVVLLRAQPSTRWIQVESTRKALGFQKTLALEVNSFTPLPANPQRYAYAAGGVFFIPCAEATAASWLKLIPNSHASRQLKLYP
jgi:hypothetical protein